MTIRDILNEATYNLSKDITAYTIDFIHRGAENDTKTVKLTDIVGVYKGHFEYLDTENPEGITYIPYHRILKILDKDDIVYEKRK